MYVCQGCLGSLPTLKKISSDIKDIKISTSSRFDDLENRVDNIEGSMKTTVTEEVGKLKEDLKTELMTEFDKKTEEVSKLKDDLKSELMNEFDKKLKEKDEISKRVDNLIFFNVQESKSKEVKERIEHDTDLINKVCQTTGVESPNISQAIRLGSKTDEGDTNRPLKIKFALKSERRTVLTNSRKIAQSSDKVIQKVSIARDLTESQRSDYKEKVESAKNELKTRIESGETGIERRGLRIVKTKEKTTGAEGGTNPFP